MSVGRSKLEEDSLDHAKGLLDKAKAKGVEVLLPVDNVVADDFDESANTKVVEGDIDDE